MKATIFSIAAVLAVFLACPAFSAVTGPCANCHTMHNSQNGAAVDGDGPNSQLLTSDCVGCHSATDGSTWKDPVTGAPIVYNTSAPTYGADAGDGKKQGLAAGNFYWVDQDDSFGHNMFTPDATLSSAPGKLGGCGGDCHDSFVGPACEGCHHDVLAKLMPTTPMRFHHADDSDLVVNSDAEGWYRFLKAKMSGGVIGIEDPDWEHTPTSTAHNEYLGNTLMDKTGYGGMQEVLFIPPYTVTGFCTGCHANIHVQNTSADGEGEWIRHPSDAVIPNSGEYAAYTTYDPLTPVARSSLTEVSATVTPGSDMVMCLSCHRAHGSPYSDMLRFDYADMQAGGGGAADTGCFKCHSAKDGS